MLMTLKKWRDRLLLQEDLNFLLTNRIPRLAVTRFVGRFSQIRHPWVARVSIGAWRMFSDLDLSEARKTRFESLHDCFVRELKPGARPVDQSAEVLASPSDGIVGECGAVDGQRLWQAKGFPYSLSDLFGSEAAARPYENGCYVTLRLTASMYHRFHAPHDAVLRHVTHIAGDTWNVNPIALKRVERLFCRNERASLHLQLAGSGHPVALVPVAAILVASLRLHAPDLLLHHRYGGPNELPCEVPMTKGQELGWFQHGSTIIVFAPKGFTVAPGVATGVTVRAGQALMRLPEGGA